MARWLGGDGGHGMFSEERSRPSVAGAQSPWPIPAVNGRGTMTGLDTPPAEAGRFSVLRRSLRHGSPKPLPKAFYVLGGVVVPMEARAALRAAMPAYGQAFGDDDAAARAGLAGVGRRHGYDSPLSVCCFGCEDAQELRPRRITDALGEVVNLDHV